ncbi:MAG: ATP-grasp domain-containing protein [Terrimicrobiaceae bacterium]
MSQTILITGIGGDIGQSVALILRESRPDIRLIGVDIHSQHGGPLFVDRCELVPAAAAPGYFEALKGIVQKHSVDFVIPMSEPELGACLPFQEMAPGVKWITPGARVVETGLDKLATISALTGLGIPVPWTIPAKGGSPICYPCILKSRYGSGSRSVFTLSNGEDLSYLVKRWPDAVLQEMLLPAERELTCAVYRTLQGRVASLLMLRRLTGGFTGWAKVIHDEDTSRMCEAVAHGLDLRGSMNIQLRLTDQGPRIFEINPRFSSTVLMRHRIGFTDVLWALSEAEGQTVQFPTIPIGVTMVRIQGAMLCHETK